MVSHKKLTISFIVQHITIMISIDLAAVLTFDEK